MTAPATGAARVARAAEEADVLRVKGFLPEGPKFWNWLAVRKGRGGKAGGGIMLDTQMEGATVLGSLELTGKTLLVTVNSAERAAKVQKLIGAAAGIGNFYQYNRIAQDSASSFNASSVWQAKIGIRYSF